MNTHFPECLNSGGSCCPWMGDCTCQCICDVLRACERRVLNAAREAVRGVNWFNDEGMMLSAIVATAESIAAIDALKEKS